MRKGLAAQETFYKKLLATGRGNFGRPGAGRTAMVVVSRPYNGFDPGINLNIPKKLRDLGVLAIPMDFFPLDQKRGPRNPGPLLAFRTENPGGRGNIKKNPQLYGIYITNFSCGPDSFILHFFRDVMRGKPYLEIEIDEHSADAGVVTRLEAFLDSLKNVKAPPVPA